MIEDILKQVKGSVLKDAMSEYGLTEQKAEQSVDVAQDTIMDGFKNELSSGNISGLLELFQGKSSIASNPIVTSMVTQYGGKLISQLGLSPQIAEGLSKFAIPFIMNQFTQKTSEQNLNEESMVDMLGSSVGKSVIDNLKGKLPGGLGDALGGLFK